MKIFIKGNDSGHKFSGIVECDSFTEKYLGLLHQTNGKIDVDWRHWTYVLRNKNKPEMYFRVDSLTQFDVIKE